MKYHNVCLTITNFANRGGEERMCATLANALAKEGYHVIIVSTDKPSSQQVQFAVSPEIKCYFLKSNRVEGKLSRMALTKNLWLQKYKMILKRHKIQVVIDVDVHNTLVTSKVVCKEDVRIVSWHHFNYDRFLAWSTRQALHDCFCNKVNKLVVLTKSDQQSFVEREGIDASLVSQIYNPSPVEVDAECTHTAKKVLAIGRLQEQKGFDMLLQSWARVEQAKADWTLEIVGDGFQKEELEGIISKLGLRHVVISPFTSEIKKKYQEASIYVLSSRYEGFALVLLEAMAMSLPIVSFDCHTGPSELIENGRNGFIVPPLDTDALADKLIQLINDGELRQSMSHRSYEMSAQYRMKNILPQWIQLLESI